MDRLIRYEIGTDFVNGGFIMSAWLESGAVIATQMTPMQVSDFMQMPHSQRWEYLQHHGATSSTPPPSGPEAITAMLESFREAMDNLLPSFQDMADTLNDLFGGLLTGAGDGKLSEGDLANLTSFIAGQPIKAQRKELGVTGRGSGVYTTSGGYYLLTKAQNALLLDLDIATLVHRDTISRYRDTVIEIHAKLREAGVPVLDLIPVGRTALNRGPKRGKDSSTLPDLKLVHRQGLEAVFSMGDKHYLSAYDSNENPPLYFLCTLPEQVGTVDEARESLKPKSVKLAEAIGKKVKRQGDLFAIPSDLSLQQIKEMGGEELPEDTSLYGTAHTCKCMAKLPNGMLMGSGNMVHKPSIRGETRGPDHAPLKLGGGWYFIMKNTVPISGPAAPLANPLQDMLRGWGMGGVIGGSGGGGASTAIRTAWGSTTPISGSGGGGGGTRGFTQIVNADWGTFTPSGVDQDALIRAREAERQGERSGHIEQIEAEIQRRTVERRERDRAREREITESGRRGRWPRLWG